jgi:hypothetical protein
MSGTEVLASSLPLAKGPDLAHYSFKEEAILKKMSATEVLASSLLFLLPSLPSPLGEAEEYYPFGGPYLPQKRRRRQFLNSEPL